ncbi:hypothetical protein [Pseudomonas bharatica]|uniref:hypothetical protein n=1 Tax=Pseudomonas bharatica TaxID=2692112 RepID=UPI001F04D4F2|nr:hypothetical protein [Pseudomonas bharatica]
MIIGCALFMELLDSTAVLTALPQLAADFGEPSVRMNLVVTLYLLAVAMFIPSAAGWPNGLGRAGCSSPPSACS